jgi:hypothetical protein
MFLDEGDIAGTKPSLLSLFVSELLHGDREVTVEEIASELVNIFFSISDNAVSLCLATLRFSAENAPQLQRRLQRDLASPAANLESSFIFECVLETVQHTGIGSEILKTRIVRSKSRNLSRIAFHALPLYLSQKNVVFWGPRVEETIAFDLWPLIRKSTTDLFDPSINLNVDATRRVLGPQSGPFSANRSVFILAAALCRVILRRGMPCVVGPNNLRSLSQQPHSLHVVGLELC